MNELVMQVLLLVIGLMSAVVAINLVPFIKSKATNEQMKEIEYWTNIAIQAIENYYKDNPGQGKIKKEFVIDFIESLGLNIAEEQLDILIDALVKEMNEIKEAFKLT